ncbi:MAG: porin, partial [Bdellovibrionales bacterium]|nr:porin [Bdellovibrionales bacterium]
MRTRLLPLAAAVSFASVAGLAHAEGPIDGQIYGKINVTVQSDDEGTDSRVTSVKSNASRLGFKGETALEQGPSVIYQIEYEANIDDGDNKGKTITQRNSFVGLKGSMGTLLAGIHDTPMKEAQGKIDLFNDVDGDLKTLFNGEVRAKNTLYYNSPSMSGFSVDAAYVASETDNVDDGISLAAKFKTDNLYAALAYDTNVEAEGLDTVRLVGEVSMNDFTVGAMWQQAMPDVGEDEDGLLISASYKIGATKLKIQHGQSDIKASGGEQTSIGADYKLGK